MLFGQETSCSNVALYFQSYHQNQNSLKQHLWLIFSVEQSHKLSTTCYECNTWQAPELHGKVLPSFQVSIQFSLCLRLCDILTSVIRFISTLTNHYKLSLFSFSIYYSTTMDLICSFLCTKFKTQQFSCIIHFHLLYLLNSICSFELINHHSLSSLHFAERSYYSIYLRWQRLQSFPRFLCIHEPIYHLPVSNISKVSLLERLKL